MSSSSKQTESKQSFEHQFSYISACILFVGQQGLNNKLESAINYVILAAA